MAGAFEFLQKALSTITTTTTTNRMHSSELLGSLIRVSYCLGCLLHNVWVGILSSLDKKLGTAFALSPDILHLKIGYRG